MRYTGCEGTVVVVVGDLVSFVLEIKYHYFEE
jgi:hypothetical protein